MPDKLPDDWRALIDAAVASGRVTLCPAFEPPWPPKPAPPSQPASRMDTILKLARRGKTIDQISALTGLSNQQVSNTAAKLRQEGHSINFKHKVEPQARKSVWMTQEDRLNLVRAMLKAGKTDQEIGRLLNLSKGGTNDYFYRHRKKGNLPPRVKR